MHRLSLFLIVLVSLSATADDADEAEAKRQAEQAKLPPHERLLKGEDAKSVQELNEQLDKHIDAKNDAEAIRVAKGLVALRAKAQGSDHHEAIDAKWELDRLLRLAALSNDMRAKWREATEGGSQARKLSAKGQYAEALVLDEKLLAICRESMGREHAETAIVLNNVATDLYYLGRTADAERAFRSALGLREKLLGEHHPDTATSCNGLASVVNAQGKHAQAEQLYRDALRIWQRVLGEDHLETAQGLNNLAFCLHAQGKFADAELPLQRSLAIRTRILGENHSKVAESLGNIGALLRSQGRYAEANLYCRKTLAIRLAAEGANHPQTALAYINLGSNLVSADRPQEAVPLFERALGILRKTPGEEHPLTATTYNNLASTLADLGNYETALQYHQKALAIRLKILGVEHRDTAGSNNNIGFCLVQQGAYRRSEPFLRSALATYERALGNGHPLTARCCGNLTATLNAQGNYAEAAELGVAALAAMETARLRAASAGMGRATLEDSSHRLFPVIALLHLSRSSEAYQTLEGHLGRGLLDDLTARQARVLTPDEQQELDGLNAKLALYEKQLGNLLAAKDGLEANRAKFEERVKKRQAAETSLAQLAAQLQQKEIYDWKVIQKHLPAEAALITWLDLVGHPRAARPQGEHWAFLLKNTGEPIVVELKGSGAPHPRPLSPAGRVETSWTDEDTELASELRPLLAPKEPRRGSEVLAKCRQLGQQRLGPLEPHLTDVKHLIVLPSEALAGIPLEALTDRFTVSYAPSGTVLAKLVEGRGERARPRKLLAVGDPAYAKTDDLLQNTRREVLAIGGLFTNQTLLTDREASAQRLEQLVKDDQLKSFDVLHFAAHGQADPHVALYTKLRLAADATGRESQLTAGDIYQHWRGKLAADLVVLSACETGLGRRASGEGYLGFTQPLFLAGARSIVLSQWPVSDEATALLMVRFYENWLGRPSPPAPLPSGERGERRMTKAEALREAKSWLRNLTREQAEAALGELTTRTRTVNQDPAEAPNGEARPFAHPTYWSAFILIGDPQ